MRCGIRIKVLLFSTLRRRLLRLLLIHSPAKLFFLLSKDLEEKGASERAQSQPGTELHYVCMSIHPSLHDLPVDILQAR